jgi:hypothetical protein
VKTSHPPGHTGLVLVEPAELLSGDLNAVMSMSITSCRQQTAPLTPLEHGKYGGHRRMGKPREGFHADRMAGDLARNDVLGTVVIAGLISAYWDVPL